MKRQLVKWLEHPEYVEFLKEYIPGHSEAEIRQVFFDKYHIILNEGQIGNFKHKHNVKSGTHGGCFTKGHEPFNKGKKMPPETYAKVQGTMFKKGQMPVNHKEVGTERINVDGYIEIKVKEPNKWRLKQRVVYEDLHQVKLTRSDVVIFLDGNKQNFDVNNLFKLTRAELARYCKDHLYTDNPDIARAAAQIAKIKVKTGELRNEAKTRN